MKLKFSRILLSNLFQEASDIESKKKKEKIIQEGVRNKREVWRRETLNF